MNFKAGYAAIIGLPNAGKSTLLNALLGQKISITTDKPQTTRKRILGILTESDFQIIFLDTPGIISPDYLLQEKMMEMVNVSVKDADIILLLLDIKEDKEGEKMFTNEFVKNFLEKNKKPKILLINKIDLSNEQHIKKLVQKYEGMSLFKYIFPISAELNFNLENIKSAIVESLPEHPAYFPDDIVADETERFFVSEIIREKIFEQYKEEIPYSCEVMIYDYKERDSGKDYIQAEVVVEKETQKGIIIGKQGAAIKKLGQTAREAIEKFLQKPVYLEIRVKVREKWRSDERFLKAFGYSREKE